MRHYPLRRLEAEVLIDALDQITGTTEQYSSAIPEPFTFIPEDQRSIALPDGSITSSFLELFGRPPRDTGLESERNNRPTADAAAAPAEFEPYPAEDREQPQDAGIAPILGIQGRWQVWKARKRRQASRSR